MKEGGREPMSRGSRGTWVHFLPTAIPLGASCNGPRGQADGDAAKAGAGKGVNGRLLCFGAAERWESMQAALGYI